MEEQEIRSRMLSYAAKTWGFADTAIENSFDPLVNLLLGASAHELEKVYNEIHSTESRLLLKLTQLLTPDVLTGATPAHAICHATPTDLEAKTTTYQHFYFQKKRENGMRETYSEVFFTPSGEFLLTPAEVRLLACGNKLFNYKTSVTKETIATAIGKTLAPNTIFIGIEPLANISDIKTFTLFFENRNPAEAAAFYKDLASAKFYFGTQELTLQPGIEDMRKHSVSLYKKLIESHYNITTQNETHATSFYNRHFVTLELSTQNIQQTTETEAQAQLENAFGASALQKVKSPMLWITMELPPRDQPFNLSDIFCATNCFPVINRKKEDITYRIEDKHTIIALQSPSKFLDIIEVRAQDDTPFFETAISNPAQTPAGSYLLRHSGVGRFDKRSAVEYTQYMLQLLRDESASFSALGRDFIETQVKQVNQVIASIEQRMNEALLQGSESISYLLLNTATFPDNVFIQYWNTDAADGNNVRPGTKLNTYQGNAFMRDSVILMTNSTGGKNSLSPSESVNVYKNNVLTRQRIVTPKDIEVACAAIAGNYVDHASVKKGVIMESGNNGNYTRCIEVNLHFKQHSLDESIKQDVCREVLVYLENNSSGMFPFKVTAA
ncbi:MAG: type VI secretion system baseplate subunit TssF [Chitinophagales bacterium]|nr:type VI secretion system baseplate subunit TssF [Chitinophagales bacterium]